MKNKDCVFCHKIINLYFVFLCQSGQEKRTSLQLMNHGCITENIEQKNIHWHWRKESNRNINAMHRNWLTWRIVQEITEENYKLNWRYECINMKESLKRWRWLWRSNTNSETSTQRYKWFKERANTRGEDDRT